MHANKYLIPFIYLFFVYPSHKPYLTIVDGFDAILGEFPSFVALRSGVSSAAICGGCLLSSRHALTVAHCVTKKNGENIHLNTVTVSAGEVKNYFCSKPNCQSRRLRKIIVHPHYKPPKVFFGDKKDYDGKVYDEKVSADIAFVIVRKRFSLGWSVAVSGYIQDTPSIGTSVTIVGYTKGNGKGSRDLQFSGANIQNMRVCNEQNASNLLCVLSNFKPDHRVSESGSPIFIGKTLVAVAARASYSPQEGIKAMNVAFYEKFIKKSLKSGKLGNLWQNYSVLSFSSGAMYLLS